MKYSAFLTFLMVCTLSGQTKIELAPIDKKPMTTDWFVGMDNQANTFYIEDNALHQIRQGFKNNYANIQLGKIDQVDIFNPLKINVFYKDFNTVTVLDNRLNEIYKIDFNDIRPYRDIRFCATGHDNTIWLFNQNSQQLEIFDYKQGITRGKTLPIEDDILAIESNFNSCWLMTKDTIYVYNYFGSMIGKIPNEGFTDLVEYNDHLILKKGSELFFSFKDSDEIIPLDLPELLISAFFATDETLYIYDGEFLHSYQLKFI